MQASHAHQLADARAHRAQASSRQRSPPPVKDEVWRQLAVAVHHVLRQVPCEGVVVGGEELVVGGAGHGVWGRGRGQSWSVRA
jgi:hypothetical protein